MEEELGINCRLRKNALVLEEGAELGRVGQVAVVCECDIAHPILDAKWLKPLDLVLTARRRVPRVADCVNPPQRLHVLGLEHVSDEAVPAVQLEIVPPTLVVRY